jgi:hypothetical protein
MVTMTRIAITIIYLIFIFIFAPKK